MVAFYHRHVPMFSDDLFSLYNLLKKNVNWIGWEVERQAEFNHAKLILSKANILYPFDPDEEIIIMTDASQEGVGYAIT